MTGMMDSMRAVKKQMDDQIIAMDLLAGAKAASSAYYMAVLESPTPELRSMFKAAHTEALDEYSGLIDLALNRGWLKPYDVLEKQLEDSYREAQTALTYHHA